MEDSEKVEIAPIKVEETDTKPDEVEKEEEKSKEVDEVSAEKVPTEEPIPESEVKHETVIPEVNEIEVKTSNDPEVETKVMEEVVADMGEVVVESEVEAEAEPKEEVKEPPLVIEECDTGGDEVPDIPAALIPVLQEADALPLSDKSGDEPVLLAQLTSVAPEQENEKEQEPELKQDKDKDQEEQVVSSGSKPDSDVVALDDDDEDDDGLPMDDSDDPDEGEDEDDDVEGVSNEALNDEDEEDDDEYLYGDLSGDKKDKSSHEVLETEEVDVDDDYDEDDDEDDEMLDLKDDSMGAVVIGSSDEEEPVPKAVSKETTKPQQQLKQALLARSKQQSEIENFEDIELDYDDDEEDDDDDEDEDEYDDDDLMNAVVTSAAKNLSPVKKRQRSESPVVEARQREAHQISVLTRRINYGRIVKKKSLNWLYNKTKREAYKLILPKHKPRNTSEAAMRSDQSGGLLHLKISSPTVTLIGQRSTIKSSSTSTPIISRPGPASRKIQHAKKSQEECVIDLDSSPEKTQDKVIPPRQCNQSDDQRKLEFDPKKPPDSKRTKEEEGEAEAVRDQQNIEEEPPAKMQQTDKVRDSIQKSTEEVEEVKTGAVVVDRLKCEQNKENLQSNDALKKESDEIVAKVETEVKDATALPESMETSEPETNETAIKAASVAISSVTTLITDIKVEKLDKETASPVVAEEVSVASKVTIEDVPEKEATASPHSVPVGGGGTVVAGGANKRRRSSSSSAAAESKSKTSKTTAAGTAENTQDDDEEYIHPTKKLREELQNAYPAHDRILNEYIEKTSNDSIDTIQRHIDQMVSEIQTLNDMIKAKELEWNNMLNLKKVKEEICYRLTRRKQCLEIMSTKVGETARSAGLDDDYAGNESAIILGKSTPAAKQNIQLSSTPIQAAISSLSSNICNFTAVSSSSSAAPTTAQLIVQNRANMKSSDLVKEKANTLRLHRLLVSRNILPKPNTASASTSTCTPNNSQQQQQQQQSNGPTSTQPNASNQPILNSYLTSTDSVQQLVDMMNGHHNHSGLQNGGSVASNNQAAAAAAMVGRQGPFKDVRSIIADFRQQHPEVVPRRGRRVKTNNNSNLSDSNTILGNALKSDTNSRPSSNDSSSQSLSNTNQVTTNHNSVNSFKDVLAPFSKSQGAVRSGGGQQQNPPYPEVTLHPVSTPLNASGGQDQPTGSLLHGILTKFSRPTETANTKSAANYISNFSPTLARLLTAPERISPSGTGSGPNQNHHNSSAGVSGDGGSNINNSNAHHSMPSFGVNLSKVVGHNSEITITPVLNSMHQQSILQQQLQQQQLKDVLTRAAAAVGANNSVKDEHFLKLSSFVAPSAPNNDDDAEDSVDRLVIDEGDLMTGGEEHQRIAPHAIGQEFNENEVPVCQGCKKHEAQFVCAGCGNQWYCSRECQVSAWDDHSEVCTATKPIRNNFNMLKSRDLEKDEEYLIIRRRKRNKFPQFY